MEGAHPTIPSVKIADALYIISNQFIFSLKIENCKFQQKSRVFFLVIYMQMYILYSFQCEILD